MKLISTHCTFKGNSEFFGEKKEHLFILLYFLFIAKKEPCKLVYLFIKGGQNKLRLQSMPFFWRRKKCMSKRKEIVQGQRHIDLCFLGLF